MANLSFNRARNASNNGGDDSWKAQAFINIYLPTPDGGKTKLGAIALRENDKFQAAIIKRLSQEGGLSALVEASMFDFRLVSDSPDEVPLGF